MNPDRDQCRVLDVQGLFATALPIFSVSFVKFHTEVAEIYCKLSLYALKNAGESIGSKNWRIKDPRKNPDSKS